MRPLALLLAAIALAVSIGGCSTKPNKVCTQMACSASAQIKTKVTPAEAADGVHTFTLDADGVTKTCTVKLAAPQRPEFATCDGNVALRFGPVMRGETVTAVPGMVGYTEVPVPGEFEWQATVYGQPKSVKIVHTFQGKTILERTATPKYADTWPNGPGCEPACPTSTEVWAR